MIRLLRLVSASNRLRLIQHPVRQMCSNKSDDPSTISPDSVLDEADTKSEFTSTTSDKINVYKKYSFEENNAILTEMLNELPSDPAEISLDALTEFFQRISAHFIITPAVIRHPKFSVLREATQIHLPQLNTKELKNLFVAIFPSKAMMHDKLNKMVVDALVNRVNYLPFDQIIFLDFILHKYYNLTELSKDYNILRLKLQTMFLSKVETALNEMDDFEELMKIVSYCENNAEIIPPKIVNSVATSLLLSDDDKFSVTHITSILIMLAAMGKLNEHVGKLLHKATGLWCQSTVTPAQVQVLLKVLAAKKSTIDRDRFKDLEFIRRCVEVVTQQNDRKLSFSIQNSFNRLNFESKELIEHLSTYFEGDLRDLSVADYIIICTACAKASYTPTNWDSKVLSALKTFKFGLYLTSLRNFDWAQFALNLDQIGYCDRHFIRKIIQSKYFRSQKCYDQKKIDKLREILERECANHSAELSDESDTESSDSEYTSSDDESPLYDDLKNMFGVTKVWENVRVSEKLTIPFVLKMDLRTGDFLPFSKAPSIRQTSDNELLIGVAVVSSKNDQRGDFKKLTLARKQGHRMEKKGISAIILEESKWNTLKTYEKSLVFYTKIVNMMEFYRKNKLKQLGRDL